MEPVGFCAMAHDHAMHVHSSLTICRRTFGDARFVLRGTRPVSVVPPVPVAVLGSSTSLGGVSVLHGPVSAILSATRG